MINKPEPDMSKAESILRCNFLDSWEIINARYKELAKKYHPDIYPDDTKMKEINWAYQIFKNNKTTEVCEDCTGKVEFVKKRATVRENIKINFDTFINEKIKQYEHEDNKEDIKKIKNIVETEISDIIIRIINNKLMKKEDEKTNVSLTARLGKLLKELKIDLSDVATEYINKFLKEQFNININLKKEAKAKPVKSPYIEAIAKYADLLTVIQNGKGNIQIFFRDKENFLTNKITKIVILQTFEQSGKLVVMAKANKKLYKIKGVDIDV